MATPTTLPPRGRDDVVTGEAVALDLPVAGFGARLGGALIDALVTIVVLVLLIMWGSHVHGLDTALSQALSIVMVVAVLLVLPIGVEIWTHGRSLGKLAAGTRVVRVDHGELSPRHSLVRGVIGLVEIWLLAFIPAVLTLVFSRRTQRLGDFAAGTIVVKNRIPINPPAPVPMPPHLAAWAHACDLGAVPPRLAMSARAFLARRHTLSPQARNTLGHVLAAQALACVSPPPPPAHPEDVLAAVLAERGRRDHQRWVETSSRWARLTAGVRARGGAIH